MAGQSEILGASASPAFARATAVAFFISLAALLLPLYIDFAADAWRREENAHALIIMAVAIGAAAIRLTTEKFDPNPPLREQISGFAIAGIGVAFLVGGRAIEADLISSSSQFLIALGSIAALYGAAGVRRLWFPIALTLYLIIWPGWAIDSLTAPLKLFVSEVVANALYAAGLPVAHAGAVISAGQYQLLVAKACSGLNSLIALTAIGFVYLYAVKHKDWRINTAVVLLLAPIAIIANIARVAALTLITYYLGYDAGQGFMHEGAGLLMFSVALALVFAVDALAITVFQGRRRS